MTIDEWIQIGVEKSWCGPPVCATHDGVPATFDEEAEFDDGYDPCISILRLYQSADDRRAVEDNHPPSSWRRSGWEVS